MYRYPPGRNMGDMPPMQGGGMISMPYDIGGAVSSGGVVSQPIPIGALASALANASPDQQRTVRIFPNLRFVGDRKFFELIFSDSKRSGFFMGVIPRATNSGLTKFWD